MHGDGKFKAFRALMWKWVYFLYDQHLNILCESHEIFRQSFRGGQFFTPELCEPATAIWWFHFSKDFICLPIDSWLIFIVQVKSNNAKEMIEEQLRILCKKDWLPRVIIIIQMPFILAAEKNNNQLVFKCIVCTSMAFRNSKSYSYRATHLSCSYVICQYFRLCRQISAHRKCYRGPSRRTVAARVHRVGIVSYFSRETCTFLAIHCSECEHMFSQSVFGLVWRCDLSFVFSFIHCVCVCCFSFAIHSDRYTFFSARGDMLNTIPGSDYPSNGVRECVEQQPSEHVVRRAQQQRIYIAPGCRCVFFISFFYIVGIFYMPTSYPQFPTLFFSSSLFVFRPECGALPHAFLLMNTNHRFSHKIYHVRFFFFLRFVFDVFVFFIIIFRFLSLPRCALDIYHLQYGSWNGSLFMIEQWTIHRNMPQQSVQMSQWLLSDVRRRLLLFSRWLRNGHKWVIIFSVRAAYIYRWCATPLGNVLLTRSAFHWH